MRGWKLEGWIPLGASVEQAWQALFLGLGAGIAGNLLYLLRYASARNDLFRMEGGVRVLVPGSVMPTFRELLGRGLYGCWMAMLAMVPLAWLYWSSHTRGSMSLYTMKRLPNRWELPRRCFTVPLVWGALFGLEGLVLWQLDFLLYWFATPAGYLPPVEWWALWSLW